jgi:predicted ester cyclase
VVIELTWEGTHSGPMATPDGQELAPSNKRMTVKSVEVLEIKDGKIKVLRHYFDLMTILQQIGAMDPAGTAVASRLHRVASDG